MQKKIKWNKLYCLAIGATVGLLVGLCGVWLRQNIWSFSDYPFSGVDIGYLVVITLMGILVAYNWVLEQ